MSIVMLVRLLIDSKQQRAATLMLWQWQHYFFAISWLVSIFQQNKQFYIVQIRHGVIEFASGKLQLTTSAISPGQCRRCLHFVYATFFFVCLKLKFSLLFKANAILKGTLFESNSILLSLSADENHHWIISLHGGNICTVEGERWLHFFTSIINKTGRRKRKITSLGHEIVENGYFRLNICSDFIGQVCL